MTMPARIDAMIACFTAIQQHKMADVPLLHPALSVEAVDFRPWTHDGCGYALGVLITPWMMKIMALPLFPQALVQQPQRWTLPSGHYDFDFGRLDGLGEFYSCSLFSPMQDFADQDAARSTAQAVMQQLLQPPQATPTAATVMAQQPLSRREFLRGRLSQAQGER